MRFFALAHTLTSKACTPNEARMFEKPARPLSCFFKRSFMMKRTLYGTVSRFLSLTVVLTMLPFATFSARVNAQSLNLNQTVQNTSQFLRVSGDLLELVLHPTNGAKAKVIVQLNGPLTLTLRSLILVLGGEITDSFDNFNALAVTLPELSLLQLVALPGVTYVSPDRPTALLGHLSSTTGADSVRSGSLLAPGLDGSGVGIAVLDSGIYTVHKSFQGKLNNVRVVFSKDFTGEGRTDDPYGHGSHVASIAAGNGVVANGAYIGIAPNANLINLRVLNSTGTGTTSTLLSGLNWVMSNRGIYNIRVVNMSLGAAAIDSYRNDPICKAVRKLVDAGVVVVAAAGNNGKDVNGRKLYGQIHSPGIEPAAVTVGASNTYGTDSRADDAVTTYSSRGPTRGYSTELNGLRHYDNLVKPDLVAPGNKLIEAEAVKNALVIQHPELDARVSTQDNRKMMYLSGTSMATPVVAGAAALLLQANPRLTPNLVKAILMYTAQPLAGFNTFEQGMGEINIEGAVRLARLVRTDLSNSTWLGAPLLVANAPAPQSTIGSYTFSWSQGMVLNNTYATGPGLITLYQKIYNTGGLLGDGILISNNTFTGNPQLMTGSVGFADNITTSSGVIAGDGGFFCSCSMLMGDGVLITDGQPVGDGVIAGDCRGVIAGDTGWPGDSTTCMAPVNDSNQ